MCTLILLAVVMQTMAQQTNLLCAHFTGLSLEQQPVAINCSVAPEPPGVCAGHSVSTCRIGPVFQRGAFSPNQSVATTMECGAACIASDMACRCTDVRFCVRTINDANFTLECFRVDDTVPANYCDEDDDLTVDCTKPPDYTVPLIFGGIGGMMSVMFLVYCCVGDRRSSEERGV